MNTPEIYLVEPYNAYAPKGRKKHWHELVEEQALLAKILAEQQAIQEAKSKTTPPQAPPSSVQTVVGSSAGAGAAGQAGSGAGGGGMPVWDYFNPAADSVDFSAAPLSGPGPLTVQFTNTSTIESWDTYTWDFGDGTTSTDLNPTHVYQSGSAAGYDVTLTASYSIGGFSESIKRGYISASIPAVVAKFTYITSSGPGPVTASFTNTSTNSSQTPTTTYLWTFGDGWTSTSADALVVHPYATSSLGLKGSGTGSFTASLQATGSYNIASKYTQSFYVPAPTLNISFTVVSSSNYSPAYVTLTPTITYNGHGTYTGNWYSGEWPENGTQYTLPYAGAWTNRLYDTRSAAANSTGSFTASLQITESTYGIAQLYTQSFALIYPTLKASFTVASASKVSPSLVTFTDTSTDSTSSLDSVAGTWSFGEYKEDGTQWTSAWGIPYSFTYATRSAAAGSTGSFTASLQLTESRYGQMSFYTQSFYIGLPTVTPTFTVSPGAGTAPHLETFTDATTVLTGSGDSLIYLWTYGSASLTDVTVGSPPALNYTTASRYTASLQVTESLFGVALKYTQSWKLN